MLFHIHALVQDTNNKDPNNNNKNYYNFKSTSVICKVSKCWVSGRVNITHKSLCIGDKKGEWPDNPQACKLTMFNLITISNNHKVKTRHYSELDFLVNC